jgi:hypothetical protein
MLDQAQHFLRRLDPGQGTFLFQLLADRPRARGLHKTMLATLDKAARELEECQSLGLGVFVTINATTGAKRRVGDVERVRAVFVDLDGSPLEPVLACPLEPHLIVESSPGKFHIYWLVDGLALEEFRPIQKGLAERFNGDRSVSDLPRVMRLPGFWHLKGEPFMVRMVGGMALSGARVPPEGGEAPRQGITPYPADQVRGALRGAFSAASPDLILLDVMMPGLRSMRCTTPFKRRRTSSREGPHARATGCGAAHRDRAAWIAEAVLLAAGRRARRRLGRRAVA